MEKGCAADVDVDIGGPSWVPKAGPWAETGGGGLPEEREVVVERRRVRGD